MKFKLDEHMPVELAEDLRQAGHDALTIADEQLGGVSDEELMRIVQAESRIILTMDKGIANVLRYPPHLYPGIVLFRPSQAGRGAVLSFVRQQLPVVLTLIAPGKLVVVTDRGIRRR